MASLPFSKPVPLSAAHHVEGFDCGSGPLNVFLQRHALGNQGGGSARTFVACSEGQKVVGYYSLTAASIDFESAPDRVAKGQPKHPIPAILMAHFAVDLSCQGQGLGRALFRDAVLRSLNITKEIGARAFVVDAKDEKAIRFYVQFGMAAAPGNPNRLYLLYKDIKQILREA